MTGSPRAGGVFALAALLCGMTGAGGLAAQEAAKTGAPAIETATGATSVAGATPSANPAAAATAEAPAQTAPVDPLLAAIRDRLDGTVRTGSSEREDWTALGAYYRDHAKAPLWVSTDGLTARGLTVAGEIAKADAWGLSATAFDLPDLRSAGAAAASLRASEEIKLGLAILKYARHARGGRLDPAQLSRYFDQKPSLKLAEAVLRDIAAASEPDAYLRALHPRHPQFESLRQALLKARNPKPATAARPDGPDLGVKIADGAVLKAGQEHASVDQLRQRLGIAADDAANANVYDAKLVDAVKAFQREQDLNPSGRLDKATRAALNKERKPAATGSDVQRLIANMERWRWLPENLGDFHVWDNIPEYQTRVMKAGQVIHQARIIVGKPETQTPLFSADMRYVVFHPGWGVPDSIKVKELLPYLRPSQSFFGFDGSDTAVLRRHNLVVSINGQPVDPSKVNWQQVDIRRYQFVQPPGAANVLGVVKFRFPNKHDVYMHDTSQRELFQRGQRTFSHGCVRVDNPRRLAEILLDHDRGMSAAEVGRLITSGPQDNQLELKVRIPVHITYFTAFAEADGSIKSHPDIYGHDARVTAALTGRAMPLEPAPETAPEARREPREPRETKSYTQSSRFDASQIFSGLSGN